MEFPIIDKRTSENVYEELVALAKRYAPEWRPDSDGGEAGSMLARVFSEMFSETINRFNIMPFKNYLFFLNLLGADTLSAVPAKGYVTVKLNPGEYEGVHIEKGTRVYSFLSDGQRVTYELKDDMLAANNKILEVFCRNKDGGVIVKPYDALENAEMELCPQLSLFDYGKYGNLQNFGLTILGGEGFNVPESAEITLHFINEESFMLSDKTVEALKNPETAKWFAVATNDDTEEKTAPFACEINDMEGAGNKLSFRFPKNGEESIESINKCLCSKILLPPSLLKLDFTDIRVSSKAEGVSPEFMYYNDIPLTQTNFMPFGDRFSEFDDFCFCANNVFNQPGARIRIDFVIKPDVIEHVPGGEGHKIKWRPLMSESEVKTPPPDVINIDRVIWEYWNGSGWARLFPDNRYEDIFNATEPKNVSIKFLCPGDFKRSVQGAASGRWLRARVLSVSDIYGINQFYNVPTIDKLSISYDYGRETLPLEGVYIEKNLETMPLGSFTAHSREDNFAAAYISFEREFFGGPYKLYFKKEDSNESSERVNELKYEYYGFAGGVLKWIEIKPMDETDSLNRSGVVTFIIKQPMEKLYLYGRERYWIRISYAADNNDAIAEKPVLLRGIHLNTCGIYQQETMRTEYFAIEPQQVDKLCVLENNCITEINVWVNEEREILTDKNAIDLDDVVIKRNERGVITDYWVRWEETDDLFAAHATDRVYTVDRKTGSVLFGNGKNGKIPPYSSGAAIKIEYDTTMGEDGNIPPFTIEGFADSVPFVDKVYNIEAISGGYGIEKDLSAVDRHHKIAAIQDRAVSAEDFEVLVKSAERSIRKVKILRENGRVTIIIMPEAVPDFEGFQRSPDYFEAIKSAVKKMLFQKGPVTLWGRTEIREARYVQFKIIVDATVLSYNDYHDVNRAIETELAAFLNPVYGGSDSKGFEIGRMPTKTRIYMVLKSIDKIIKINSLNICCYELIDGEIKEIDYDTAVLMGDAAPVSGRHEITIGVLSERRS